jgi:molybdopterin converting factor small subunit
MQVKVRPFAQARDALRSPEVTLDLPPGARVRDALDALERVHPALAGLRPVLATAVDGALVREGATLADGAELALLPPVSGG